MGKHCKNSVHTLQCLTCKDNNNTACAGIVRWSVNDLKCMDKKTRKLLTIHRRLHPRSDVDCLNLPRKRGGRGLKSVEDVVTLE